MKRRVWKWRWMFLGMVLFVGVIGWQNSRKEEVEIVSYAAQKSFIGLELPVAWEHFAVSELWTQQNSSAVQEEGLGLAEIQGMAAGTILDLSRVDADITEQLFYSQQISDEVRQRISGVSYQENNDISLADLRYLRVLYRGFDGETHIGELIVNTLIAEDILEIMSELYKNQYPLEKMTLVDAYGGEDETSMRDNNTSAFNYRRIAGSSKLSLHSLGLAIDINPKYNPYVKTGANGELSVSPENAVDYADRSQAFEHKIDETDLCYQLFINHGFIWGGSWNTVKDYQHFEYAIPQE